MNHVSAPYTKMYVPIEHHKTFSLFHGEFTIEVAGFGSHNRR